MNSQLSTVGILGLVYCCTWTADVWSASEAPCVHIVEWEEVNVVGLKVIEHRRIMASEQSSIYLPTRHVVGPVRYEDYILRVVVDTERRYAKYDGSERETDSVGADMPICEDIVRQFSDENLVDFDVVSSNSMGSDYPAGTSLKDLFDVSVELTLKNGTVPKGVFAPRNVQTLSQYMARGPKQPLVVNLRLNLDFEDRSAHVFDVLMFVADGDAHSVQSEPVVFIQ